MSEEIWIAPMSQRDIPEVALLEAACFSEPWSENSLRGALESGCGVFLAARCGTALAGYCGLEHAAGEGYITNVAVDASHRRRGVARALMQALRERCTTLSLRFISLEVRESNAAAIALYAGCGYQRAGLRRRFYRKPEEDAVIMTLTL